jgi:site-specific DNA-methyltransferase (cytosine-N4-specific)
MDEMSTAYCIGPPHDAPEPLSLGSACPEGCGNDAIVTESYRAAAAALDERWEAHLAEYHGIDRTKDVLLIARLLPAESAQCSHTEGSERCLSTAAVRLFRDLSVVEDRCERHAPMVFLSSEATCDKLIDGIRCGALAELAIPISKSDPNERVIRCFDHCGLLDDLGVNLILEREFDHTDTYWYYRQEQLSAKQRQQLARPRRKPRVPPLPASVPACDPSLYRNRIFPMSCEDVSAIPDDAVNVIVTSPPYFKKIYYGFAQPDSAQTDREAEVEIGWEATAGLYVRRLVHLMRGWWRILADDGVLFLNLGDSMASGWACVRENGVKIGMGSAKKSERVDRLAGGFKEKDCMGIPFLVAAALREDGWYWRQDLVWHKPDAEPAPWDDRCQQTHEYLFIFAKSRKYAFRKSALPDYAKSSVWTIATDHVNGEHQAVMPRELARACIAAAAAPGALVCDPFMGSGTVAIEAKLAGCDYVGYELYRKNRELAARRLASEGIAQLALLQT